MLVDNLCCYYAVWVGIRWFPVDLSFGLISFLGCGLNLYDCGFNFGL